MIPKDIISNTIIPLRTSDFASKALSLMEEFKVAHIPIVNNEEFLGLISENDIYSLNEPNEVVGNHTLSLNRPYVNQNQHIYDVIRIASDLKLTIVPVLDEKTNIFLGVITQNSIIDYASKLFAVQNPGGIIVLEMGIHDYSLQQIAQIVESNDAKILSLFVITSDDSMQIEVTLKINKTDVAPILQTFHRYDYIVKASFDEGDYEEDLRDRYDSFLNYLNI
ncbi:MAG: CBS domain-containing protein [Bacteroidota bacterium]